MPGKGPINKDTMPDYVVPVADKNKYAEGSFVEMGKGTPAPQKGPTKTPYKDTVG